jgi:hypothetical protein
MRHGVLVALLAATVGCGPQFPAPDTTPREAPVPEGRTAAKSTEEPVAPPATAARTLHVDHAWVKAPTPAEQTKRRRAIETLRARVIAGSGFVVAWESLGEDGDVWHVAEGETYDVEVVPEAARDLPVGQVSAVIPGDGGFHLFRIVGRE